MQIFLLTDFKRQIFQTELKRKKIHEALTGKSSSQSFRGQRGRGVFFFTCRPFSAGGVG